MPEQKNPGAGRTATGALGMVQAGRLNYPDTTTHPDFAQLRDELKQQQKQALEAALRDKFSHDDDYLGLPAGWLSLIASIEGTLQALTRIEREGGL